MYTHSAICMWSIEIRRLVVFTKTKTVQCTYDIHTYVGLGMVDLAVIRRD